MVAGCNQKSSRDPIMHITKAGAQMTLDALRGEVGQLRQSVEHLYTELGVVRRG